MTNHKRTCKNCKTSINVKPGSYWAKAGAPDNCPTCNTPYNQPAAIETKHECWDYYRPAAHATELNVTASGAKLAQKMTERKCRKCGGTKLSGATFTTMASSGICDDCI